MSLVPSLAEAYKTADNSLQLFNDLFGNGNNSAQVSQLSNKIIDVVKGSCTTADNNVEAYQNQMVNLIKEDVMKRVAGLANINNSLIENQVYNIINNFIDNFNSSNGGSISEHGGNDLKRKALDKLNSIAKEKMNQVLKDLNGNILSNIVSNFYGKDSSNPFVNLDSVSAYVIDTIFPNVGELGTEFINSIIDVGTFSEQPTGEIDAEGNPVMIPVDEVMGNFCSSMGTNFKTIFENIRTLGINSISNILDRGIQTVTSKLNANVNACFTEPIKEVIGTAFNELTGANLKTPVNLVNQALNYLNDKMTNASTLANNSVNNLKQDLKRDTTIKAASIQQEVAKHTVGSSITYGNNKTVQNRNQSNNGITKFPSNKPTPGQYDNTKPQPAKIKSSDPRRNNTQEIVMWEKPGEEYVLVRDAKGNYLLLDEAKENVRIQHKSGSFIELRSSGDIMIEAKHFVYINTVGASPIERY